MKITAIKAQIKKPDRVSIFIDGTYNFSLTQTQLLEEKLYSGLEIDQARQAALKKTSDFGKLYERILRFTALRPRSVREIELYCQRKNYTAEDCTMVIEKLSKFGYINDTAFAKAWVESRHLTKPMSIRALRAELKQKGIADEQITAALASNTYDEAAILRWLIKKKRQMARYRDPQKLLLYLTRQGFGYDTVKSVLQEEERD